MNDIKLLSPELNRNVSLMTAIKERRTIRKWNDESLSLQAISNILWCACGETKIATKRSKNRRTIPSACNGQVVTVYVALDSGIYEYIEETHTLRSIIETDIRNKLGTQKMMSNAPFGIIYVGTLKGKSGIIKTDDEKDMFMAAAEVGAMSQNVYLYAASANMNTVLIGLVDRAPLRSDLQLNKQQRIIYTQIVGTKPM